MALSLWGKRHSCVMAETFQTPDYWRIPRIWEGQDAWIVGGGPSLTHFNFEQLRGENVIVINRMVRLCPWAAVLYFCDKHWWTVDKGDVDALFTGEYIITTSRTFDPRVKVIRNLGTQGLSKDPAGVKHGTNSGFQAINLAYLFGARRIGLLGFDMKCSPTSTHAHGGYGTKVEIMQHNLEKRMLPFFDSLVAPLEAEGIQVVNCNPDSNLECWPRMPFIEAVVKFAKCATSPL